MSAPESAEPPGPEAAGSPEPQALPENAPDIEPDNRPKSAPDLQPDIEPEPQVAPEPKAEAGNAFSSQRTALLRRTVAELTREWRASVRAYGEFDALLVRGQPVDHNRHLLYLTALAVLALGSGQFVGGGFAGWVAVSSIPLAYALFWLFLAVTGGEEFEHISVDEAGKLHSVKSGRSVNTRGDFIRVAVPAVVIAITGWFAIGLAHDVVFPPPPKCNVPEFYWPQSCYTFPRVSGVLAVTPAATTATTPDGTAVQPIIDGALSVDETKSLERFVHAYLLIANLCFLLPTIWFLARMLTGRNVATIRPISRTRRD